MDRVPRLRRFWEALATDPAPALWFWFGRMPDGPWREACNQLAALQTMVWGRPGLFRPRLQPGPRAGVNDVPPCSTSTPWPGTSTRSSTSTA